MGWSPLLPHLNVGPDSPSQRNLEAGFSQIMRGTSPPLLSKAAECRLNKRYSRLRVPYPAFIPVPQLPCVDRLHPRATPLPSPRGRPHQGSAARRYRCPGQQAARRSSAAAAIAPRQPARARSLRAAARSPRHRQSMRARGRRVSQRPTGAAGEAGASAPGADPLAPRWDAQADGMNFGPREAASHR